MKQGIRFFNVDGSVDDYDLVEYFTEGKRYYESHVLNHFWEVPKRNVKSYEFYPLCEKHGYENSEKYKCYECEIQRVV